MSEIQRVKTLLDEINAAISGYDPVLKERARDILLRSALPEFESGTREGGEERGVPTQAAEAEEPRRAETLRELAHEAPPRRASEAALLGAYFLRVIRGQELLGSQAINAELKRAGLTVSNITRAIETNLNARPPLMEQVTKLGFTKQARKQYHITDAGISKVEQRLDMER